MTQPERDVFKEFGLLLNPIIIIVNTIIHMHSSNLSYCCMHYDNKTESEKIGPNINES